MNDVTVAIITGIGLVLVALIEVTATFFSSKLNAAKVTGALDKQLEVYKTEMNGKFEAQKQVIELRFNQFEKELQKTTTCSVEIPVMKEQIDSLTKRVNKLEGERA